MDPQVALDAALRGDAGARHAYNTWVRRGGYMATMHVIGVGPSMVRHIGRTIVMTDAGKIDYRGARK